jgi:hypothetical protein
MDPAVFDRMKKAWDKKRFSDLADDLEVKPNTLHSWRSRGKIPFEYLERTARLRHVSLDWLVLGLEAKPGCCLSQESPAYGTSGRDVEPPPATAGVSLHALAASLAYAWLSEHQLGMPAEKFAAAIDALVELADGSPERLRKHAERMLPLIAAG